MSEYNIEKGVPIPPLRTGLKEALMRLEVGDSFAFPDHRNGTVRVMIAKIQQKFDRRFLTRKLETEWRVWRTK